MGELLTSKLLLERALLNNYCEVCFMRFVLIYPVFHTSSDSASDVEEAALPVDYTLSSIACLQAVYHALLLPGGCATSVGSLKKYTVPGDLLRTAAFHTAGLPESLQRASEVADLLTCIKSDRPAFPMDPFVTAPTAPSEPSVVLSHPLSEDASLLRDNSASSSSNISEFTAIFTNYAKVRFWECCCFVAYTILLLT